MFPRSKNSEAAVIDAFSENEGCYFLWPSWPDVKVKQLQYKRVVEEAGLFVHADKFMLANVDKVVPSVGLEVSGRSLTAGVAPAKTEKLKVYTLFILRQGEATGLLIASLVCSWIWRLLAAGSATGCQERAEQVSPCCRPSLMNH